MSGNDPEQKRPPVKGRYGTLTENDLQELRQGYLLAMGLSIVGMIHATAHHHFFWPGMRTGMQIRVGLIGMF
ncbi:hypothetical protein BC936DRAFT_148109 [Jimgerdemannia flammicorona]|uniref:Uncharacterized protein n=1 Tax=Jimgerdemannia flammicorona TaxID=994334 RepID=A0A433D3S5_9FUNG|nr:hypothetical protein BC936DRAFT_148109 [Jimgerdemannia flammicorona]